MKQIQETQHDNDLYGSGSLTLFWVLDDIKKKIKTKRLKLLFLLYYICCRPAWVPWTVLDRLFLELSENTNVPVFAKCLNRYRQLIP